MLKDGSIFISAAVHVDPCYANSVIWVDISVKIYISTPTAVIDTIATRASFFCLWTPIYSCYLLLNSWVQTKRRRLNKALGTTCLQVFNPLPHGPWCAVHPRSMGQTVSPKQMTLCTLKKILMTSGGWLDEAIFTEHFFDFLSLVWSNYTVEAPCCLRATLVEQ
jgi:hypothetical protein